MRRIWIACGRNCKPALSLVARLYVRNGQLVKKYGKEVVPPNGPIPAHLLGNIWAQEWNNVYELMDSPKPAQSYDLTKILVDRKTDAKGMVKYGENFFVSVGFAPLPPTSFGSARYSPNPRTAT